MTLPEPRISISSSPPGSPVRVIVLCGGRGSRLRPITDQTPKGMAPIHGRPMLDHILDFYYRHGCNRFTLCIGYLGEVIRAHFAHPPGAVEILFADAGEEASMLQRLWQVREQVEKQVIVAYGDTFIDLDPDQLLAHHRSSGAALTLVTTGIRNPFGVVRFAEDGLVAAFEEKPILHYFIGCFVMERRAFAHITEAMLAAPDGTGLVALLHALIPLGLLGGYRHTGLQICFNTSQEYQEAEAAMQGYYTCLESP